MATKLKGLRVHSVDFVDQGANPDATIALYKRREPEETGGLARFFKAIAKKLSLRDEDADEALAELAELTELAEAAEEERGDGDPLSPAAATAAAATPEDQTEMKEEFDVKIDKSKLSPEEIAQFDAIMKKAGMEGEARSADGNPSAGRSFDNRTVRQGISETARAKGEPNTEQAPAVPAAPAEVEKAAKPQLPPEVAAELAAIRKMREAMEERELTEVAKKYEPLGKKPEELVPVLKGLRDSNPDAYAQYVAMMDETLDAIGKSRMFEEVGRNGHSVSQPWEAIEKRAGEIMAANPNLNHQQAIMRVGVENPQLVADYENSREGRM